MLNLLEGIGYTVKEEGFYNVPKKVSHVLSMHRPRFDFGSRQDNSFFDVIFINGCDYSVPHPIRYRVDHQIEELEAAGLTVQKVNAWEMEKDILRHARTFIIFRCPLSDEVESLIRQAKKLNKRVIYDIDDLVIDTAYTDSIPFVNAMTAHDKSCYDDGVRRMGETLKLCDCAITTTEGMAEELKKYVPRVYINRNVASESMIDYSNIAIYRRDVLPSLQSSSVLPEDRVPYKRAVERRDEKQKTQEIRIGYFSGSITHNADFNSVLPALSKVMETHHNVTLMVGGELDVPDDLMPFSERIVTFPFCDWRRLPNYIASCDINIAPLENTLFNRAKSENKWIESSLVKVPTVASNVGAFKKMIQDGVTGFLCDCVEDWCAALNRLILDSDLRKSVGESAYLYCHEHCTTVSAAKAIRDIIVKEQSPNLAMVMPSVNTSGGVLVALRHLCILQDAGVDVLLLNTDDSTKWLEVFGHRIPVLNRVVPSGKLDKCPLSGAIDTAVATLWDTLDFVRRYPRIGKKKYLVQNLETDFYLPGDRLRLQANATYLNNDIDYLTISPWCEEWLQDRFGQDCKSVPNGLDLAAFPHSVRDFSLPKIRILIEGDCGSDYKNVDEAFRVVERLDSERYEIWYMNYTGKKKPWYRFDNFLGRVPHDQISDIYNQCHILLKTSILESFSYPPLEMMATGGFVVAVPNGGNAEFLRDGLNCLLYDRGDIDAAVSCINRIVNDHGLRKTLYDGGLKTAEERDWSKLTDRVVRLYD